MSPDDRTTRGLRDFEVGETFTGYFVIRRKELRSKRDGGFYLALEFGDRTGRLSGNIWDDAERLYAELNEGEAVKLQGFIETYRDSKQVGVKRIRPIRPDDQIDPASLIPSIEGDTWEMLERLKRIVGGMKNEHLKRLLSLFLDDPDFVEAFTRAPGGKLWHHNRLGGLMQHTLSLVRLVRLLGRFYPEIDRELLTAGAILHDIGKIEEYCYSTMIDYSDRGRLVGHISIGAQWIARRAADIPDFPAGLLDQLVHLVLSHQAEFGSPVQPATREAFILHYADQMDSKLDAFNRIAAEPVAGRWKYVKLLERFIDLGVETEKSPSAAIE